MISLYKNKRKSDILVQYMLINHTRDFEKVDESYFSDNLHDIMYKAANFQSSSDQISASIIRKRLNRYNLVKSWCTVRDFKQEHPEYCI